MNLPFRPPKKKKLQATATRRVREADYTEEPNVKLSSAFVVVLVLHVVAVGGIYAFNAIKSHQPPAFEDSEQPQAGAEPVANTHVPDNTLDTQAPATTPAPTRTYRVKSGDTIAKIASANGCSGSDIIDMNNLREQGGIHVGEDLKLPAAAAPADDQPDTPKPAVLKDSGNTYTVLHGDTPVGIARKLHVAYDDLMRLNKIEDPKKLKIGMKLKIPVKHPAA
jgi:LysM repeat protein